MEKIELVLIKPGKKFTDYRHLIITEAIEVCILNIIKGRLYSDKKTMNPTYEPYPTKQETVDRLNELANELRIKGFVETQIDVLFQIPEKEIYVYDKAKWHYEGDFPKELESTQAYVPTGMFITWLINNDMISKRSAKNDASDIDLVKRNEMTGAQFYSKNWDGVLSSKELSDEADAFAREYLDIQKDLYTAVDFTNILAAGLPTIYHVQDSIKNYHIIEPIITKRYREWKSRQRL
ncbi:MAG TPA: hypothetical protein DEF35_02565 [Paenibacillus sp.]|uniref:DUF7832 domain-containing protein n=1 Tax=Paenibacillus TaxID=44249 RepID=UPI000BA124EB|nr:MULTISPECIES: hypothetical protein [Paenibacillus]OZQ64020.1 hypothetical protein CA599_23305 [Paenibacillus taichungensis]HBU80513.1 hypothetical protein [Paenibacillus sp.]